MPQFSSLSSAAHITNNVFLQLTVDDIGICLPLNPCRTVRTPLSDGLITAAVCKKVLLGKLEYLEG